MKFLLWCSYFEVRTLKFIVYLTFSDEPPVRIFACPSSSCVHSRPSDGQLQQRIIVLVAPSIPASICLSIQRAIAVSNRHTVHHRHSLCVCRLGFRKFGNFSLMRLKCFANLIWHSFCASFQCVFSSPFAPRKSITVYLKFNWMSTAAMSRSGWRTE